jgi:hypothetical protein
LRIPGIYLHLRGHGNYCRRLPNSNNNKVKIWEWSAGVYLLIQENKAEQQSIHQWMSYQVWAPFSFSACRNLLIFPISVGPQMTS